MYLSDFLGLGSLNFWGGYVVMIIVITDFFFGTEFLGYFSTEILRC